MTAQSMATRKESDALGEVTLAGDCLYGVNTARGREIDQPVIWANAGMRQRLLGKGSVMAET